MSVSDSLFIQRDDLRTRVVLRRDGEPVELRIESSRGRGLSGNIYRGKVMRIAAEMDAAFVDIGLGRMGLLAVKDVWLPSLARERPPLDVDKDVPGAPRGNPIKREIGAMLEIGQEIMVQVIREPVAKKGPRVTMFISLPGRNLVFLGREPHIGVSKRIDQPEERARLRQMIDRLLPRDCGAVVRTVGENATEAELVNDVAYLRAQWRDVQARYAIASAPSFLFHDTDLVLAALRDLVTPMMDEVWLDEGTDRQRVEQVLATMHPEARPSVRVHDGSGSLFAEHGLDAALVSAIQPRVSLPGGGDVMIERTEAMTVIDVNAGKRIGDERVEDAVVRLNLAAARVIAAQLRLRNIGGLVVIDFVDMVRTDDRRMVEAVLEAELSDDPARIRLSRINRFGLVVMTRKRERESIYAKMTETCPTCDGQGHVRSAGDLAIDALARLRRALNRSSAAGCSVTITVPARVAVVLKERLSGVLRDMERAQGVTIKVKVEQMNPGRSAGIDMRAAK